MNAIYMMNVQVNNDIPYTYILLLYIKQSIYTNYLYSV